MILRLTKKEVARACYGLLDSPDLYAAVMSSWLRRPEGALFAELELDADAGARVRALATPAILPVALDGRDAGDGL